MKNLLIALACLCSFASAQSNDLGLFGVGNFNGCSFFYVQGGTPVDGCYKSSAGGGVEYRHWFTPTLAVGLWGEANPSEGIQFTSSLQPDLYNFPLIRYEFGLPVTLRFWTRKKIKPFAQFGFGYVVTQSLEAQSLAGWSYDFNLIGGGGFDYAISKHWSSRVGFLLWDGTQGCYNDPSCHSDIGQAQDLRLGAVYGW